MALQYLTRFDTGRDAFPGALPNLRRAFDRFPIAASTSIQVLKLLCNYGLRGCRPGGLRIQSLCRRFETHQLPDYF